MLKAWQIISGMPILRVLANKKRAPVFVGRPFRYTQYVILTAAGAVSRGSLGVHSLGSFLLQALC